MPYASAETRKAARRRHYLANRQKYIDGAKRRQDTKRWRAKRKAAGLKVNGDWERRWVEYVNASAKRGKEYWPRGCRVPVVKVNPAPPQKPRKPWCDPSLTKAEQWKMRYRMDPEFQAREYLKALKRKRARRQMIAESGLPQWRVSLLRIQSHQCAYCDQWIPEVTDRVVDHVVPLSKGGAHAWDNLAVVCKPCNAAKFNKSPTSRQVAYAARQRADHSWQLPLVAC